MIPENTNNTAEPQGDAPKSVHDVFSDLENYHVQTGEALAEPQTEDETEEPEITSDEDETSSDDGESGEAKEGDEEKPEETEPPADLTAEELGESDFASLEEQTEPTELLPENYPDVAAFQTKYPRQQKAFYEEAASFAAKAKIGDEITLKIGGKEYIEPVAQLARGIRENDQQAVFEGIVNTGSSEALLNVAGHSVFLVNLKAKEWAAMEDQPEVAELGKAMLQHKEAIIAAEYGEGITSDTLAKLVHYEKLGLIEKFEQWKEQEFVDSEEFYELCEADKSPEKFTSILAKQKQTEAELAEARAKLGEQETAKVSSIEKQFATQSEQHIEKSLVEVVWKNSVLKEVAGDSPELKETKSEFRNILIEAAKRQFRKSEEFKTLADAYKRGDSETINFKKAMTRAINTTLFSIKEKNGIYERTVANLYGKTRNNQVAKTKKAVAGSSTEVLAPTETTVSDKRPMTQDEIVERMAADLRALG